jgi:hypothetical protein
MYFQTASVILSCKLYFMLYSFHIVNDGMDQSVGRFQTAIREVPCLGFIQEGFFF